MNLEHHYRAVDVVVSQLAGDRACVYMTEGRSSRIVTMAEAEALQSCDTFQTLAAHAERLAAVTAYGSHRLETWLRTWVDGGFLVAQETLHASLLASAKAREPVPAIESISVLTKNRSSALERCLLGFATNLRTAGRQATLTVFDNATEPGHCTAREVVRTLISRTGVPISYVGALEKRHLAASLVTHGVPEDVATFALFGAPVFTRLTGANRNSALLLTSGALSVSVDDDEECRVAAPPVQRDGLGYYSGYDPSDYWFFSGRDATLAATSFVDVDVLGLHERLLGQPVPLIADPLEVSPRSLDVRFVRHMTTRPGRVRATLMGIVGDCGMATPRWLGLTGASRNRLVETETGYRSAFSSPEILKIVDRETISAGRFCMTGCIGYDGRELLPPFFPGGRNTDGVFGTTLRCGFPDAYFGHLPWALLHTPETPRMFPPGIVHANAARYDLSDILGACIRNAALGPAAAPPEASLRRLGTELRELGELPIDDFEEYVHLRLRASTSVRIRTLEQARRDYGRPGYWADDVARMIESLESGLVQCELRPRDFAEDADPMQTRLLTRDMVRRFGLLLAWWPAMVNIGASLRQQENLATFPTTATRCFAELGRSRLPE